MFVTPEACKKVMSAVTMSRRKALAAEMAVGVAIFATSGNAGLEARRIFADLYEQADSDANEFTGQSYRTVRRRVDAAASLYERLGQVKVDDLVGERRNAQAIGTIQEHIESLSLYSINAVFGFCDKPVVATVASKPVAKPLPKWRHIETEHLEIEIPPEVTAEEAEELSQKLHAVAERLRKQELKAA